MNELRSSDYEHILNLLRDRTGLVFRDDQRETIQAIIDQVRQQLDIRDRRIFCLSLREDELAFGKLVDELTVGETYFFREMKQFREITDHLVPKVRSVRPDNHRIRCWSAGCASGEEAYSLAILFSEQQIHASILATDISSQSIEKAQRGIFREWSLRGDAAKHAGKHLTHVDDAYHLDRAIVDQVKFARLNLAADDYPSFMTQTMNMDLILCRNVLIYFADDTITQIFTKFFDSLLPGGWLVTASSDPRPDKGIGFETIATDGGVFLHKPLAEVVGVTTSLDLQPQTENPAQVGETTKVESPSIETASTQTDVELERNFIALAEAALGEGDYEQVIEITARHAAFAEACVLHLKALANIDLSLAVTRATEFLQQHNLSPDLHFMNAILLMQANEDTAAVKAAQRALFLDRSLAAAHFLLGSIFKKRGLLTAAKRHFRNARDLCRSQAEHEVVALTEDELAGDLAAAAEAQLQNIDSVIGASGDR